MLLFSALACLRSGRLDWIILLAGAVVIAASGALLYRYSSPVVKALGELDERLNAMASGDYNQKIEAVTPVEAAGAVKAFNRMAGLVSEAIAAATADRDRFSIILSHMADGIFVVDTGAHITLINVAAERMFKLRAKEAVGVSFIEATHDSEVYKVMRQCLDSGAQQSSFVETRTHRLYLGVVATPLQHNSGCILLVQDLTEIRRLETVRRDFVTNISHELRTPIASLKALAETLGAGAISDPAVSGEFLTRIEVEVDKLAQMTKELGELSNIESGVSPLVKEPTDVNELVSSAVERLRAQAKRAGLELLIDVPSSIPEVLIDRDRIERVLVNLIHNSIKFTPSGGRITVAADWEEDGVAVSVTDTGVGIDPADLPRIFERFYKADKARSGGGTGLGLAIARHTIEAHGGRIWAESTLGAGTTIHFNLPAGASNN